MNQQNIFDLERNIQDLDEKKNVHVYKTKELENLLSSYRNRVRANGKFKLPDAEYKSICNKQDNIKKQIVEQQKIMSEIQKEISRKLTLRDEIKAELKKQEAPSGFKEMLVSYRDNYIAFAADKTRVSSMRAMAAEFAEKLENIIKTL